MRGRNTIKDELKKELVAALRELSKDPQYHQLIIPLIVEVKNPAIRLSYQSAMVFTMGLVCQYLPGFFDKEDNRYAESLRSFILRYGTNSEFKPRPGRGR